MCYSCTCLIIISSEMIFIGFFSAIFVFKPFLRNDRSYKTKCYTNIWIWLNAVCIQLPVVWSRGTKTYLPFRSRILRSHFECFSKKQKKNLFIQRGWNMWSSEFVKCSREAKLWKKLKKQTKFWANKFNHRHDIFINLHTSIKDWMLLFGQSLGIGS
jgi:hypothetical protein